jgi:hypothetical protein
MEFCASAKLLKSVLDSTTVGRGLGKSESLGLLNAISLGNCLCFLMLHYLTPNG